MANTLNLSLPQILEEVKQNDKRFGTTSSYTYTDSNRIEKEIVDKAKQMVQNQKTIRYGKQASIVSGIEVNIRTGEAELIMPISVNNHIRGQLENQYKNYQRVNNVAFRLRKKAAQKGLAVKDETSIRPKAVEFH